MSLVSSPEVYLHEWASFTTKDFPENRAAKCGDRVRIVMTDVEDVLCPDEDYQRLHAEAGLAVAATHRPLGRPEEPHAWGQRDARLALGRLRLDTPRLTALWQRARPLPRATVSRERSERP